MSIIYKLNQNFSRFSETVLSMGVLLWIRYQLFDVFYYSGRQKIRNWEGTLSQFTDDFNVPFIPPEISAYLATGAEFGCSILILVGFMTRYAALALFMVPLVIYFFVYDTVDNLYWMMLLAVLVCYGAGKISMDSLLCLWCRKKCSSER